MPEKHSPDTFKPSIISLIYQYEIDMWVDKFHCSLKQLRLAIHIVGPEVEEVGAYMKLNSPLAT